jgi:hypothetical protein
MPATVAQLLQADMPDDPADLAVSLYLPLARQPELLPACQALEDRAAERVLQRGHLDPMWLRDELARGDGYALSVLLGIDFAFEFAGPGGSGSPVGMLASHRTRLQETGRLSGRDPAQHGALLGRVRPRAESKVVRWDLVNVVVVSPAAWSRIDHDARSMHVGRDRTQLSLAIGGAPMTADPRDLDWKPGNGLSSPAPTKKSPLRDRIAAVLQELDDSDAQIALLPECTLSPGVLELWREALSTGRPRHRPLRWLILGTGPVGPAPERCNRAVLVSRAPPWRPRYLDKLSGFEFGTEIIEAHGLRDVLKAPVEEVNECTGGRLTVFESPFGRIAIVVSDDLFGDAAERLAEFGVTLILSPALLTDQVKGRAGDASEACATALGTHAVVATTLIHGRGHERGALAVMSREPTPNELDVAGPQNTWIVNLPQS